MIVRTMTIEDYDGVYAANLTGLSRHAELWQALIAAK